MQNTEQPNDTVELPMTEILTAVICEVEAQRKQIEGLTEVQRNQAAALVRCGERLAMIEGRLAGKRELH